MNRTFSTSFKYVLAVVSIIASMIGVAASAGVTGVQAQSASAAATAPAGCTLTAPATAQAGGLFVARWNLNGGTHGVLTDNNGAVVATTALAIGNSKLHATGVLGPHQYTLTVTGGTPSTCTATVDFEYTPQPVSGYDIVVVAGQSNAAGVGNGPFSDPTTGKIDSQIVQMGRIGASDMRVVPVGYWQDGVLTDGLQFWKRTENDTTMAFGITFARRYVRKELQSGRKVLIVPAAYGGTSIMQWLGLPGPTPLPIYQDMIARVNAALALPGDNKVVAFLWHQGETDINWITLDNRHGMTVPVYKNYLTEFFADVRRDIPATTPYPILAGLMVPTWDDTEPALDVKKAVQHAIATTLKKDVLGAVVSSSGLTSNADIGVGGGSIHFNAESQVILGRRYYAAWSRLY